MTRKICCCSSVLSCFSCFSARNIPPPPTTTTPSAPTTTNTPSAPPNTSSSILAVSNDPQSPLSPATSSSGITGAVKHDEVPSGGASSPSRVVSVASSSSQPANDDKVREVASSSSQPANDDKVREVASSSSQPANDDKVREVASSSSQPANDDKVREVASSSSQPAASAYDDKVREVASSSQPAASANDDKVREVASSSLRNEAATIPSTVPDLTGKIEKDVAENVDLHGLVKHIEQLLEIIEANNSTLQLKRRAVQYLPTTSKSFSKLKDFLSEAISVAKDIIPSDAIKTVASGVLLGMGIGHMVTTSFVVVANMLERFEEFGDNKIECLGLLKKMLSLAKLVKQFQERPTLKESEGIGDVIKEATGLIVEGSVLCCTQMKSSKFSNFWKAPAMKEEMSKFRQKLNDMYTHMNAQMNTTIYDVIAPKKPRLSRGYPEHAVGIDDAVKEVLELLEWESGKKAVAVMLHGFGGMGKTTLGDAVFSKADFEGCKYSQVQLFQNIGSIPDIVELQKCILKDLMGPEETIPDIRKYQDGQRELGYILQKAPTLIYIDNVLGESELRQLLPWDLNKAKKVRLLLTARDANVSRACPRKTSSKIHVMKKFSNDEAMSFLKREVLDDMEGKLNSNQIDNIIEICGGVPLMLTLVAKVLSFEEDKGKAYNMVMQGKQSVKGQMFDVSQDYFFAYDSLPEEYKDPFLDVCAFFKGWEWETVADVVGEIELDILKKRALVTKGIDGVAYVHDVILTIGQEKAEGTRLTSAIQVEEIFHANEEKEDQCIKGIWLNEIKDPYIISASNLDRVCKSLRVLSLGNLTKVEGQCNKIFENLIFFQGGITHLPFDISKLKKLTYLAYEAEDLTLPKMPSSLRHVELDGRLHSLAFQISSTCFQQLGNLRILRLIRFSELKNLPQEIGDRVKALQELSLSYCKSIEELPISISRLQYLRVLRMDGCSSLMRLPQKVSNLQSLKILRMDYCSSLGQLAEDFGSLKSLQELNLEGCLSLRQLGEGFGSLNSLQELNLQACTALKELPNNFEKLSSLRSLNLSSCENLEDLPHGLGKLSSLVALHFHHCGKLKSIPHSIGQLKLLVPSIDLSYCLSLTELPDGFCNLSFITDLNLSHCKSLHRLPNRFGELASLRTLVLNECSSLQKLPKSFGQLKSLQVLGLNGCKSLEELCNEFHCFSSLQFLNLAGCESLEKLPEDFHCLISLHQLDLSFCPMLEGKSMDKVIKINALKIVVIVGSRMLEDRWAEIQKHSDKSWPFKVLTRQGFSTDEDEKIQKEMLTQLEFLLSEGRRKPFHLSGLPLVIVLDFLDYNLNFPWPLIEETIDDIQINFEMVYVGENFDKLPPKAKNNIIVGHFNPQNNVSLNFVTNMVLTLGEQLQRQFDVDKLGIVLMSMQLEDGEGGKYRPSWKLLTKGEMEEFVLCKCRKYLQLKQLAETSQESTINLLRELFATGEEQTCTFQKVPSGNSKPLTCTSEVLKGKTILLEMRPLDTCYDIRLASLTQLYNTEKDTLNLEIISIPLVHRSSSRRLDVLEQFSRDIPWLIIQNPWAIPTAVKYFLLKSHETETSSPSIIKIIEPNGRMCPVSESVLRVLDIWGAKAYPFTDQKIKELKEEEWSQMSKMSTLEFLFKQLESVSDQVKEMMLHRKVVCLYRGGESESMMKEFTGLIRNTFLRLSDSIGVIYIPYHNWRDQEERLVTDTLVMFHRPLEMPTWSQAEMEGMHLLNLSEHETFRFWRRISFLMVEMHKTYRPDMDQAGALKKLFQCWQSENQWMILMDEEGKTITERGKEIVLSCRGSKEDEVKGWIEVLIKSREQRNEALFELEKLRGGE